MASNDFFKVTLAFDDRSCGCEPVLRSVSAIGGAAVDGPIFTNCGALIDGSFLVARNSRPIIAPPINAVAAISKGVRCGRAITFEF